MVVSEPFNGLYTEAFVRKKKESLLIHMNTKYNYSGITGAISNQFNRYALHILIFLTALFFIITISNPATFFNDEWITLNQLRQMDNGHQMIVNEGTYGVFKNGTITPYFDVKERYLGYTLMLPVLSWPMLKFFSLFGENFRFSVLFFWAFLPILIMVILNQYRPDYTRLWGLPWIWIIFGIMAGFLLFNLIFYYPFPFHGDTVPREIAAVVFTQHILFAILAVLIFSIISLYTKDTWYSLFGMILCLGCSSYIFWATNAKDHLLTVTILTLSLFFLIRYLLNGNHMDGVSGFIATGLLAWARPEFALVMFILSTVFFILLNIYIFKKKTIYPFTFHTRNLLVPLATMFGALPFLLNNYYVNKNPFIPTFLAYLTKNDVSDVYPDISSVPSNGEVFQQMDILKMVNPLINKIISHYSIKSTDFSWDFLSILFGPENGAISFSAVAPLLFVSLIMLVYLLYYRTTQLTSRVSWVLLFLFVLLMGLPLTYIGGIQGLNTSLGITPDIRYLSPIYLVISLLSIFLMHHIYSGLKWKKITVMTIGILGMSGPIILFMLLLIFTTGGTAPEYIRFFNHFSILLACITVLLLILSIKEKISKEFCALFIGAMAISPLAWQILMAYFFAAAKFNGYPFWVPMMEIVYNVLVHIS